jgi:hypothetical protein
VVIGIQSRTTLGIESWTTVAQCLQLVATSAPPAARRKDAYGGRLRGEPAGTPRRGEFGEFGDVARKVLLACAVRQKQSRRAGGNRYIRSCLTSNTNPCAGGSQRRHSRLPRHRLHVRRRRAGPLLGGFSSVTVRASVRHAQIVGQPSRPEELPPLAQAAGRSLSQVSPVLAQQPQVSGQGRIPLRLVLALGADGR